MGKGAPRYENPYLQWAVLAERWDVVEELATEIGREHALWGWKLPALSKHLDRLPSHFPALKFVFVTKDVSAIAKRRNKSGDAGQLAKYISRASRVYDAFGKFALRSEHPVLFMSYELVMKNIEGSARELAEFIGIEGIDCRGIEARIRADHDHYRTGPFVQRTRSDLDLRLDEIIDRMGVPRPQGVVRPGALQSAR